MFLALITMTAGFVLTLAAWFAPPRSDAVLRVRIAGPATLTVGFCILVFSYILCAIEQSRCSNCCYDYITEKERKYHIKAKNGKLSLSTNYAGPCQTLRSTNGESVRIPEAGLSSDDKASLIHDHLDKPQMGPNVGYQLMPHDPGVRNQYNISYTYNPLTNMYNLKSPSLAKTNDSQGSVASYQLTSASPASSISENEAKTSSNYQIPFIDETSDDVSLSAKLENGFSNKSLNTYPPLRGNIAKLPKKYSKQRSKAKRKGEGLGKCTYKTRQYNGQLEQCYINRTAQEYNGKPSYIHSQRKSTFQYQKYNTTDIVQTINGTGHTFTNTQDSDSDFQLDSQSLPQRVSTSEKFSFCVPITPDSCDESQSEKTSFIHCRGKNILHDLFDNNCNRNNGNMFTSQTIKPCPFDEVTRDPLQSQSANKMENEHSSSTTGEYMKPSCSKTACNVPRESRREYTQVPLLPENVMDLLTQEPNASYSKNDTQVSSRLHQEIHAPSTEEERKPQCFEGRPSGLSFLSLSNSPIRMGISKCNDKFNVAHQTHTSSPLSNVAHHAHTCSPLVTKYSLHLRRSCEQAPLACSETTDSMSSVC